VIELSVVIPTYNRRAILERCLTHLFAQTRIHDAWEIVVVDDGSTDGSAERVATLAAPCDLRVIRQANQGAGAARNHGATEAQGRILLFVDDDILTEPGLVAEHIRAHRQDAGIVGLGRLTLALDGSADRFANYWQSYWDEHYARLAGQPKAVAYRDCFGGNLSVEREMFLRVGGFATDLPRYHDIELGFRLAREGARFVYLPDAIGGQLNLKDDRSFAREFELAGRVGPTLAARHPEILKHLILGAYESAPLPERMVRGVLLQLGGPTWPVRLLHPIMSRWRPRAWYRVNLRYAYWRGARRAIRDEGLWRRLTRGPLILTYHAIGADDERASAFVVQRRMFARQMKWLRARGYSFLSLDAYRELRQHGRLPPSRSIIVTFDDAYVDLARIALPILAQFDIPATAFVVTEKVGGTNDWSSDPGLAGRRLLDWDAIRALVASGVSIGAHGRTHADLTTLSSDAIRVEVIGSRADLQRELGVAPEEFAYPFGPSTPAVEAIVREAGFSVGLTTESAPSGPSHSNLAYPRMEVEGRSRFLSFVIGIWIGDMTWFRNMFALQRQREADQAPSTRSA
jgi:glycosyltransferase involved in cell wall biosynthesis